MTKESAGLLLFRDRDGRAEVLLVHPGGPFWARRDEGAWSIPKGEMGSGEAAVDVARREFEEELGAPAPPTGWMSLGTVRQAGGKMVHAWAAPGDLDTSRINSMTFELEWPPRSGRKQTFPEVDRAEWFELDEARRRIIPAQRTFIERLENER